MSVRLNHNIRYKTLTTKQKKFLEYHKQMNSTLYNHIRHTIDTILNMGLYNTEYASLINDSIEYYVTDKI